MRRFLTLGLLVVLAVSGGAVLMAGPNWLGFEHQGVERRYLLSDLPTSKAPWPLVLAFHGGGGSAPIMARSEFSRLAEEYGYLVVYPHAERGHWQVGMTEHPKFDSTVDDVDYVRELLERLQAEYPIDPKRIYAVGLSNGAMLCHRLGVELTPRFAAIAPLIGGIPRELSQRFEPTAELPVLIIQGTEDPLVPYEGGPLILRDRTRGTVLATEEAAELWARHNGCHEFTEHSLAPQAEKTGEDGEKGEAQGHSAADCPVPAAGGAEEDSGGADCPVRVLTWSSPGRSVEVRLLAVQGGGHTVPGGQQYLPERVIGRLCNSFDTVDEVAAFFARHRQP